jgi:hypothetical protein
MTDFLEEKKREISERMDELRPMVDEYQRLEAAHRALDGVSGSGTGAGPGARRGPGAGAGPARRQSGGGGGAGRGRPKGSGTRANEALAVVRESPGITIPEMAQRLGIQQNYLYRVLPGLEQDGMVRKEDRGWFPKDAA